MTTGELAFLTIDELGGRYRRRDLSPVEVTRAALERIEREEGTLNAYIHVASDGALRAARESEARFLSGRPRSPLDGVPFSLKDIMDVEGMSTTCASNVLRDAPPAARTAFVAARLLGAGAVLLGKNNMLEFAYGETHPDFGHTRNPWNLERSTAGSSTGSAATVAAGQAYFSIGTDTGGSVRLPAAYCGLVGIKATYGRVSRHAVVPLSWSCDFVGPLTRTVADAAHVLQAVAGHDAQDPTSSAQPVPDYRAGLADTLPRLRVGMPRAEFEEGVRPDVRRVMLEAVEVLRRSGLQVVEVEAPPLGEAVTALLTILLVEASSIHREWLRDRPEGYSDAVRARLRAGAVIPGVDYLQAQRFRRLFVERLAELFRRVDLLVLPTCPFPAHAFSEEHPGRDFTPYVRRTGPFNLSGYPALSIPCGFSDEGLPLGLELVGRFFAEPLLLAAAHAYEQATAWHTRRPPFPAEG